MTTTPSDCIERTLYTNPSTHIYGVPPLTSSTRGYTSAQWTTRPPIFTARLRILEIESVPAHGDEASKVTVSLLLEDPHTAELFAAAPYTHPSIVTPCVDSGRYFAVRVQGDGGQKATLGVGFDDRAEAFDFVGALGDVGRVLGFGGMAGREGSKGERGRGGREEMAKVGAMDEGEMVRVDLKGLNASGDNSRGSAVTGDDMALFSIRPPPRAVGGNPDVVGTSHDPFTRNYSNEEPSRNDDDFDDAEFGDFQ